MGTGCQQNTSNCYDIIVLLSLEVRGISNTKSISAVCNKHYIVTFMTELSQKLCCCVTLSWFLVL